jgi:uncharacterized protein (TIGR02421 family)
MKASEKQAERIRQACHLLREAERPVRIMRTLLWGPEVRARFFAAKARELPVVKYPEFDPEPTLAAVAQARRLVRGEGVIDAWLERLAESIEDGARMLAAVGKPEFYHYASRLFGTPQELQADGMTTALQLAQNFQRVLSQLMGAVPAGVPEERLSAEEVAEQMRSWVKEWLGDQAPRVRVVRELGSKALAGSERIRIQKGATFSRKEVDQLIQHEAGIHIITSLNGRAQRDVIILGAGHPGTTRTQEGLAVFAEFITGAMDLGRLQRLSDRVFAIQHAIEGADFLEIYQYFLERTGEPQRAYEGAWRVFRGAPLTGGYPLTKDVVYLDGLLRVQNFLRAAVSSGRPDVVRLLFCGKMDLDDLPALSELAQMKLLQLPTIVPPWAADPGYLLSYLAFSSFLNTVDLKTVAQRYAGMLNEVRPVDISR